MADRTEDAVAPQKSRSADTTPAVSRTISLEEYNAILNNQCPLPPRQFKYRPTEGVDKQSGVTTAWFYDDAFWVRDQDDRSKIYQVIFDKTSDFKKYRKRIYAMRTVDEFIGCFKLQKSLPIYQMLTSAVNLEALSPAVRKSVAKQSASSRSGGPTQAAGSRSLNLSVSFV